MPTRHYLNCVKDTDYPIRQDARTILTRLDQQKIIDDGNAQRLLPQQHCTLFCCLALGNNYSLRRHMSRKQKPVCVLQASCPIPQALATVSAEYN